MRRRKLASPRKVLRTFNVQRRVKTLGPGREWALSLALALALALASALGSRLVLQKLAQDQLSTDADATLGVRSYMES